MKYFCLFNNELIENNNNVWEAYKYLINHIIKDLRFIELVSNNSKMIIQCKFIDVIVKEDLAFNLNGSKNFKDNILELLRTIYLTYSKFKELVLMRHYISLSENFAKYNNDHTYKYGLIKILEKEEYEEWMND